MCKCAADCPTPRNNARCTITTTYLVALHAVLGKLGLMASHTVEVLPFREEASCPNDLLAVAAGEAVFMPDGALVLHVLVSCRGKQSNSHTDRLCRGLHPLSPPPRPQRRGDAGPAVSGLPQPIPMCYLQSCQRRVLLQVGMRHLNPHSPTSTLAIT